MLFYDFHLYIKSICNIIIFKLYVAMETSKKQEGGEVSKDAALMWIEPPYFKREGFDAFKIMQTKADDVIMASYPKVRWRCHSHAQNTHTFLHI